MRKVKTYLNSIGLHHIMTITIEQRADKIKVQAKTSYLFLHLISQNKPLYQHKVWEIEVHPLNLRSSLPMRKVMLLRTH
jgi:hypothetical protein